MHIFAFLDMTSSVLSIVPETAVLEFVFHVSQHEWNAKSKGFAPFHDRITGHHRNALALP
jgi:hypothetical protein